MVGGCKTNYNVMLQAQLDWPFGQDWAGLGLDWAGLGLGLGLGSTILMVRRAVTFKIGHALMLICS